MGKIMSIQGPPTKLLDLKLSKLGGVEEFIDTLEKNFLAHECLSSGAVKFSRPVPSNNEDIHIHNPIFWKNILSLAHQKKLHLLDIVFFMRLNPDSDLCNKERSIDFVSLGQEIGFFIDKGFSSGWRLSFERPFEVDPFLAKNIQALELIFLENESQFLEREQDFKDFRYHTEHPSVGRTLVKIPCSDILQMTFQY